MSPWRDRIGGTRDRLAVAVVWFLWFCVLAFGAGLVALRWYFGALHWG